MLVTYDPLLLMENIKIFARPEAYKLLNDPSQSERLRPVLKDAFMLTRNDRKLGGSFLNQIDFGIRTKWANNPNEISVILIFCCLDQELNGYNLYDSNQLELAIKQAIEIPFFD